MVKLTEKLKAIPEKLAVMSPRKLVLLAFVLSVFVAGIIYIILTGFLAPKPQPVVAPQYVNVVVANVDIPERTRLTNDMVRTMRVTADVVPADALHNVSEAVGRTTTQRIMKDDIITPHKLVGGGPGLAGTIPPDARAITIPVNDVTGVSGLLKAGDYVDIFLISNKSYHNAIYGKAVLQNVLLLAINTSIATNQQQPAATNDNKDKAQQQQQQPAAQKAAFVTLAVSPSDVLKIDAAMQEGTLFLALRPDIPDESYTVIPDYFQYLAGGEEQKAQQQQPVAQPARQALPYYPSVSNEGGAAAPSYGGGSGSSGSIIEVIRGNSISKVNVN